MKIFVSNMSPEITNDDLFCSFQESGRVESVKIIRDRNTGQSRGFGFIEMETENDGKKAIANLNGLKLKGVNLKVSKARARIDNHGVRIVYNGNNFENFNGLRR